MWKIVQMLLPALLVILFITQYMLPLLFNRRTWWLFRGEEEKVVKSKESDLESELNVTKLVVADAKDKAKKVKEKVNGNLKTAKDLKDEADNLI